MEKKYDYLIIYRLLFGFIRLKIDIAVPPIAEDKMDFFRKYRDVYGSRYGKDNIIIEMVWENELYNGHGKRF